MQACTLYVDFQLLNQFTYVEYLLDSIENNNPGLQASIANVLKDVELPTISEKRFNFELAVAYFLPNDLVMKQRMADMDAKQVSADIQATIVPDKKIVTKKRTLVTTPKKGIGQSGMNFCYYCLDEYNKLSYNQWKEIDSWYQKQNEDGKTKQAELKVLILETVAKQVTEEMKKIKETTSVTENPGVNKAAVKTFIMAAFQEDFSKKATIAGTAITEPTPMNVVIVKITLALILKPSKNQKK